MRKYWGRGLAAAALAFGAHGAWAQSVTGCPAGQVMQSSDPSGKNITCVSLPNTTGLEQQITNEAAARQAADNALTQQITNEAAARQAQDTSTLNALGTETAARQAADSALGARIDALEAAGSGTPADIVGTWAVSGTTNCLQSSTGFSANLNPIFPAAGSTAFVSQLAGTFIGTRTFNAGGRGRAQGTTHALSFPGTFHGMSVVPPPPAPPPPPFFAGVGSNPPAGGATVAGLDGFFTWHIQADGSLRIDDDNPVPQPFLAPPSRVGWTATIEGLPPYVGYISKDRRTIVMTHPDMQVETSTVRDSNGVVQGTPTQRFCTRHRVLTRLD